VYLLALLPAVLWGFAPILDKRGMSLEGTALQAALTVVVVDLSLFVLALLVLRGPALLAGLDPAVAGLFLFAGATGTALGRLAIFVGVDRVGASINTAVVSARSLMLPGRRPRSRRHLHIYYTFLILLDNSHLYYLDSGPFRRRFPVDVGTGRQYRPDRAHTPSEPVFRAAGRLSRRRVTESYQLPNRLRADPRPTTEEGGFRPRERTFRRISPLSWLQTPGPSSLTERSAGRPRPAGYGSVLSRYFWNILYLRILYVWRSRPGGPRPDAGPTGRVLPDVGA